MKTSNVNISWRIHRLYALHTAKI